VSSRIFKQHRNISWIASLTTSEPATVFVEIPAEKSARLRTLVKYGMTISQVAEVYQVSIETIERMLLKPIRPRPDRTGCLLITLCGGDREARRAGMRGCHSPGSGRTTAPGSSWPQSTRIVQRKRRPTPRSRGAERFLHAGRGCSYPIAVAAEAASDFNPEGPIAARGIQGALR
jgi:hypothetical protein